MTSMQFIIHPKSPTIIIRTPFHGARHVITVVIVTNGLKFLTFRSQLMSAERYTIAQLDPVTCHTHSNF
jgi:hypothetical protein